MPWDPVEAAGVGLAIDAATAEAVLALRAAGVRSILLKGASFDAWLFEPDEPRFYGDVDLLVSHDTLPRAGQVLDGLGYRPRAEREPARIREHAHVWVRPIDQMVVDLHSTLGGADHADTDPWEILAAKTDTMPVAGAEVEVLSEPARAMHVALHAASHGAAAEKPMLDLSRTLERVGPETWRAAASLAERLGAQTAFATGLRMHPAGARVCTELALPVEPGLEGRLLADSAPYASWTLRRVMTTPGAAAKARILAPRVFPKPDFMRAWYPIARRGRAGLALAYLRRLAWLAVEMPRAVRALWRARRSPRQAP